MPNFESKQQHVSLVLHENRQTQAAEMSEASELLTQWIKNTEVHVVEFKSLGYGSLQL